MLKEFVGNNGGLHSLSMIGCSLGEDGALYIAQGLTKNRKLRTINLARNNIGENGIISFAEVINISSFSLEHLDVSNNRLTDIGMIHFGKSLCQNRSFLTLNLR